MKTLWLEGLCKEPDKEKINTLKEYDLEMYYLDMDYNDKPDSFQFFIDFCKRNKIKFLVGSSFGGFLAFWLSEELVFLVYY